MLFLLFVVAVWTCIFLKKLSYLRIHLNLKRHFSETLKNV
jgi:hypothetical protein